MLQPELELMGRLSKRRHCLLLEPWADLLVRERTKQESRKAYLLEHANNETLLLNLVRLDSVGILQDLA